MDGVLDGGWWDVVDHGDLLVIWTDGPPETRVLQMIYEAGMHEWRTVRRWSLYAVVDAMARVVDDARANPLSAPSDRVWAVWSVLSDADYTDVVWDERVTVTVDLVQASHRGQVPGRFSTFAAVAYAVLIVEDWGGIELTEALLA